MRRFGEAVLGMAILGAAQAAAGPPTPRENPSPLTPVFRQDGGGWRFAAEYRNTTAGEEDLPTLLQGSSVVLDGRVHARQGVRFGGRSNLHPGESWAFTIGMADYLGKGEALAEGRHTLTLRLGGRTFGPAEFVWEPGGQ
jgi:hypothetical protein